MSLDLLSAISAPSPDTEDFLQCQCPQSLYKLLRTSFPDFQMLEFGIYCYRIKPQMESKLVSFELKDNYLLVIGHGSRDNFASMVEASKIIFAKVVETNSHRLLVDYRNLQINVRMSDAFNIVKRYETVEPQFRDMVTAAVFDASGIEFGRYWQEVSRQRGFIIEIFDDFDEAERWLKKN